MNKMCKHWNLETNASCELIGKGNLSLQYNSYIRKFSTQAKKSSAKLPTQTRINSITWNNTNENSLQSRNSNLHAKISKRKETDFSTSGWIVERIQINTLLQSNRCTLRET